MASSDEPLGPASNEALPRLRSLMAKRPWKEAIVPGASGFAAILVLASLSPGKRNCAPRDFGQKGRHFEPGDRQIAVGDSTTSRQLAELTGLFKPAVVLPVRGDWLVAVAVRRNQSPRVKMEI
jgi:hypothetical protein